MALLINIMNDSHGPKHTLQSILMEDELVDEIDSTGRTLRAVSKHKSHREGWLHRTVIGAVQDPDGNIVLVRQAPDRQDAGQFVAPVGGHVKAGETDDDALRREALEEIGLSDIAFEQLGQFIYDRHVIGRHENHLFVVYRITADPAQIVLGPEAVEHRTFTHTELEEALKTTPEIFGASYHELVRRLIY